MACLVQEEEQQMAPKVLFHEYIPEVGCVYVYNKPCFIGLDMQAYEKNCPQESIDVLYQDSFRPNNKLHLN